MKISYHDFWRQRAELAFIAFMLFGLLISVSCQAADVVQVQPAKTRLIIAPGDSRAGTIIVSNPEKEAKNVKAYLEDWKYLPPYDGTKDFKPASTTELSATNWISFVPSEFTIPAYGTQTINYKVKVPPNASGGHYAVLFFENYLGEQTQSTEGVRINLAVRVAALFYIEPKGTINRKVQIDDLKFERRNNKDYITANFINAGNVDYTVKSNFFIIDKQGMVYARGDFNDVYTFPQDVAVLKSSWKENVPRGKYDLVLTMDIGTALKEADLGEIPVITKEAQIEIGEDGGIIRIGELK